MNVKELVKGGLLVVCATVLAACSSFNGGSLPSSVVQESSMAKSGDYTYLIGPGDSVNIFVWRNPEISNSVTVRPDGKITSPLVEELQASGKTPEQLARDVEDVLSTYIKEPIVTVMVGGFVGPYSEQIRIVGEAANPQAIPFREKMTALDIMIAVGGLTEFAAGNRASIVRVVDGEQKTYQVKLNDLLRKGDINANVDMKPGDVLIIPESFF
ncbi:Polysaccharide export protein [gamma proteobacterium IMCC2047]|nr:Polysaccharide export protein [gamma proteobacterium IMCC2047]